MCALLLSYLGGNVAVCRVLPGSYEQQRLLHQHHAAAAAAAAIPAHEMGPHSAYKRPRLTVDVRPELTQPLRIDVTRTDDKQRLAAAAYKPVTARSDH